MSKTLTDSERDRLHRMSREHGNNFIGWMINAGRHRPPVAAEIRDFLQCHPDAGLEMVMDAPEADRSDSP